MTKDLPINKLKKYVHRTYNGLLALRWKDKCDVYMMSTKHVTMDLTEVTDKKHKKTLKPNCAWLNITKDLSFGQ